MAIQAEEIVTRLALVGRARYTAELNAATGSVQNFSRATTVAGRGLLTSTKSAGIFRNSLTALSGTASKLITIMGTLTIVVAAVSTKLIDMAADAYETRQKFDKVFEGMGEGPRNFVDTTFEKFGINKVELEDAMSIFAIFGKSAGVQRNQIAGFSEALVQAGVDMASFYNKDPQQVFNAISSGLAGNIRPLRAYGIFLSQSVIKARAAQKGLTGELTDAQKVMIRHELLLEQLGDSQHDFARTAGGLQNQMRGLRGRFHQLGITIGQMMLPHAIALVRGLNEMLGPAIARISTTVERLGDFSITTAVHFSWMETAANHFADGVEAFVNGGAAGLLEWLDNVLGTGNTIQVFFGSVGSIMKSLGTILIEAVIPAWMMWAPLLTLVNIPLQTLAFVLGFLADHMEITTVLVNILIARWILWRIVTMAQFMAMLLLRAVMWATRLPYAIMVAASWAHTAALVAETAATYLFATATWVALAPWIALIALFILVAVGTYMVLDHFEELTEYAVSGWNRILDGAHAVHDFISRMWYGMVDGVKGVINQVLTGLENMVNLGIDLLNDLIDGINYIPGVHVDYIEYVQLPRLHKGGRVVAPGAVNIRPDEEIVTLPGGAEVVPLPNREARTPASAELGPRIVQLVVDRKVLAEVMVDGHADIEARR